jgi:ABC-type nitrate/sulfonate/bicarbonate transport system substrate-binding protein
MGKFIIAPHMRLHEWVAEEKGYFRDAGLDYEFHDVLISDDGKRHDLGDKVGAFQTYEKGRACDVSTACHWTVNAAARAGHGRLYADAYSVSPAGIFVAPDSGIRGPEDLAGVAISVGYQSGSHYATIQALEPFLEPADIKLSFAEGLLFNRMEMLIDGEVPAVSLFSGPYYFLEQLGYRKVVDSTFMMAAMVAEGADLADVEKYYAALRRAQAAIDLRPELFTHYYVNEFPERFHPMMDVRRFGPGERIVFEPYTREVSDQTHRWVDEHGIFPAGGLGTGSYQDSIVSLNAAE